MLAGLQWSPVILEQAQQSARRGSGLVGGVSSPGRLRWGLPAHGPSSSIFEFWTLSLQPDPKSRRPFPHLFSSILLSSGSSHALRLSFPLHKRCLFLDCLSSVLSSTRDSYLLANSHTICPLPGRLSRLLQPVSHLFSYIPADWGTHPAHSTRS